jgi:hypothetical protein
MTIREKAFFLRVSLEERTGERAASGVREHREERSGWKKSMEFIDKRETTATERGKVRICRYLCGFGRGSNQLGE